MLREDAIETFDTGDGKRVSIFQDIDPMSPREFDPLGIIVHWHRRYELGERHATATELDALKRGGFRLLSRYLRRTEGGVNVIPIGMLDHSGITIYADGGAHWSDSAGWDSGTVGFIYANAETIARTGAPIESIDAQLRAEIDEYDAYLRGDVYGYVIERIADGAHLDSCWGFIGDEYAIECAREAAETCDTWPDSEQRDWAGAFVKGAA